MKGITDSNNTNEEEKSSSIKNKKKKVAIILFSIIAVLAGIVFTIINENHNQIEDTYSDYESVNTQADLANDPDHQGEFEQELDEYGDELQEENDSGNYSSDDEAIWQYCEDRWDYYDNLEGGYSGDKYTDQVFADAASRFGISSDDAYLVWKNVEDKKLGI